MKKLLEKDKKTRTFLTSIEKKKKILKYIYKNSNLFFFIRWNAFSKLTLLTNRSSENSLNKRCLESINKKRFNKLTSFSRNVFLRLLRTNNFYGFKKSSW